MVKVNFHGDLAEVDDDMFGIVKEIMRLWPNLRVQYGDPDRLGVGDPPYRIVELTPTGPVQVMGVWSLDASVLDKLHMANSQRFDIEALIDKENAKIKAEKEAKEAETDAAGADLLGSIVNHFNHGKMEYKYTDDQGEKRIVREDGTQGAKKTEVL